MYVWVGCLHLRGAARTVEVVLHTASLLPAVGESIGEARAERDRGRRHKRAPAAAEAPNLRPTHNTQVAKQRRSQMLQQHIIILAQRFAHNIMIYTSVTFVLI